MGFFRQEYWSGVPLPSPNIAIGNKKLWVCFIAFLLFFCVFFLFLGPKACEISASQQPGIKTTPPALEGKVLTAAPPGKFP